MDYNGDSFVFTYLSELKLETKTAIQTLYPLIKHANNITQSQLSQNKALLNELIQKKIDEELQSFPTSEAINRTEDMHYDNNKNLIVDPLIDNNL